MSTRLDAAVAELVAALRDELAADVAAPTPDRLLSVGEAAAAMSLGRSKVYGLIASGELRSLRVGRRRLVPVGSVSAFIRDADGAA